MPQTIARSRARLVWNEIRQTTINIDSESLNWGYGAQSIPHLLIVVEQFATYWVWELDHSKPGWPHRRRHAPGPTSIPQRVLKRVSRRYDGIWPLSGSRPEKRCLSNRLRKPRTHISVAKRSIIKEAWQCPPLENSKAVQCAQQSWMAFCALWKRQRNNADTQ